MPNSHLEDSQVSDKLQLVLESDSMESFKAHCSLNMSEESCGLFVLKRGVIEFVPCDNIAYDKKNSFLINPVDYVRECDEGDVLAVGHSHVIGTSKPSTEDIVHAANCQLPFIIFQPEALTIDTLPVPDHSAPLIGRRWSLGVSDCYSLVRDYYKEQGLVMNDYVRTSFEQITGEDMLRKYYSENGFVEVTGEPKINDMLFMQVHSDVPNHVAVMVDDNVILHHLQNRLSCREVWGGYWRRHTLMIVRHPKWS